MTFLNSIIVVDDVIKSRELYEKIMGMTVTEDHGIYNVGFAGGLALYQKELFQNLTDHLKITAKSNNFVLYFEVSDLEELEKQITSLGFEFIHHLREQPWKQKVFRFYDLDGHILEIAENMADVHFRLYNENRTVEEVAALTSIPVEAVRAQIDQKLSEKAAQAV